jgi:hypothetical protein
MEQNQAISQYSKSSRKGVRKTTVLQKGFPWQSYPFESVSK